MFCMNIFIDLKCKGIWIFFYHRCIICRQSKSKVLPNGLYTSLPILKKP
jgi:hypothetical protein